MSFLLLDQGLGQGLGQGLVQGLDQGLGQLLIPGAGWFSLLKAPIRASLCCQCLCLLQYLMLGAFLFHVAHLCNLILMTDTFSVTQPILLPVCRSGSGGRSKSGSPARRCVTSVISAFSLMHCISFV